MRYKNRVFVLVALFTVAVGALCTVGGDVFAANYTLNLTTSGAQSIDVSTTGTGTAIGVENVTVFTTCRAGYNLTLSTSVNDNNLYLNGDASNNTAGTYFAPSNGVTSLAAADSTWGYFLPASGGSAPTSSSVFNAVPVTGSPATLRTASQTASATDISDSFSVYYGVSASSGMTSGTYKMKKDGSNNDGALVYYATLAEACFSYTVQFNPASTASGTTISGTGIMNNQTIYEDIATSLTTNGFTAPSGYEFVEWNTAQDGTGTAYTDGQSVTNLTTVGGSITLYAQWDEKCPSGMICYRANGDNVVGTMGQQSRASYELLSSNFSRVGYGFVGWSKDKNAADHLSTATIYGPQETFTSAVGSTHKFYAVWVPSAGYLQNWTCPNDATMPIGTVTALTDQRDGETYAVAKLADGKCWMIENMRIGSASSEDSTGTLSQGYGGQFVGLAEPEAITGGSVANSLYSTDGVNGTINIGTYMAPQRFPRYNNTNTPANASDRPQNPMTNDSTNSTSGAGMYSYGNYYTWAAAIADTTSYYSSNQSITSSSICPSGWHLPKGGTKSNEANNEFWSLIVNSVNGGTNPANYDNSDQPYYTGTSEAKPIAGILRSYPNNFVYSGYGGVSSLIARGGSGYYWSSTIENVYGVYGFMFSNSSVYPGTRSNGKVDGLSIRCIAGS